MLPDALSMLGIGGSNHQDALLIQDYLNSWDLLAKLDKELDLKSHYQNDQADYFSRLPQDVSREDFIEYYRNHLMLRFDELSGVLTIELQAFDPEYGQQVVGLMLKESERFINKLGHQVALEQLAFVEKEVDRAYRRLQDEKAKVLAFQNSHQLISPESTSSARLGVVSQIEAELVNQQAQLKQLRSYMRENAPGVISVQSRVDALTRQLEQERAKLTGLDKDAMNEINAGYLDVQTQATLAADLYKDKPHQPGAGQGRGIPQAQTPAGHQSTKPGPGCGIPSPSLQPGHRRCATTPFLWIDRDGACNLA